MTKQIRKGNLNAVNQSQQYWNRETIDMLKNYVQLLRETDEEWFRDEIRKLRIIITHVYMNQELTSDQIEYIRYVKDIDNMVNLETICN